MIGKALVAPTGRRMGTQLVLIDWPDHLTMLVTDRNEIVQCVQDRGVRQCIPDLADHVKTEK